MIRKILRLFLAICIGFFVVSCSKDTPAPGDDPTKPDLNPPTSQDLIIPRKEMRAAWFATVWELDWPGVRGEVAQKQKFITMLDRLKQLKFNAIFFQVKGLGDAFYNSPYEPWSAAISGTRGVDPGYDVLKFLIEESHNRGIEFHAWMNPYRISTRSVGGPAYPALHSSIDESWVKDYPTIRIYNPALPEVRQRLNDIVQDLITKYDVDGIHFDDYFYPSGVTHDDAVDFSKYGAGYSSVANFRRGNVDKAIEGVYNTIKTIKPQVVFSVSPAPNKEANFNNLYADIAKWTQSGWVDILIPQLYQEIGNSYNPFEGNLSVWSQFRGKAKLVIGHGYYKFGAADGGAPFQNTQQLISQFDLVRRNPNTVGSAIYSARDIISNRIGITDVLANLYAKDVLMPFAGREVAAAPSVPSNLKLTGSELSWTGSGSNIRFAVYYFSSLTTEGELVGVTTSNKLNVTKNGYYAVTALNVDHVESKASNTVEKK
jgi:uncharacterized lipoprotein YddW (UPF0748 family)